MWARLDPRLCTKYHPSRLPSCGPGRVWLQQTDTTNRAVTSTSSETNKVDYWPCAKGVGTVLHIGVCNIVRYSWVQRATPRHATLPQFSYAFLILLDYCLYIHKVNGLVHFSTFFKTPLFLKTLKHSTYVFNLLISSQIFSSNAQLALWNQLLPALLPADICHKPINANVLYNGRSFIIWHVSYALV
jgi:hypothetical protein